MIRDDLFGSISPTAVNLTTPRARVAASLVLVRRGRQRQVTSVRSHALYRRTTQRGCRSRAADSGDGVRPGTPDATRPGRKVATAGERPRTPIMEAFVSYRGHGSGLTNRQSGQHSRPPQGGRDTEVPHLRGALDTTGAGREHGEGGHFSCALGVHEASQTRVITAHYGVKS
jgi:hypothetical protein